VEKNLQKQLLKKVTYILIEINKKACFVDEKEFKGGPTKVVPSQLNLLKLYKRKFKVTQDLEVMTAIAVGNCLGHIVGISTYER